MEAIILSWYLFIVIPGEPPAVELEKMAGEISCHLAAGFEDGYCIRLSAGDAHLLAKSLLSALIDMNEMEGWEPDD